MKFSSRRIAPVALSVLALAVSAHVFAAPAAQPALVTDKDKVSYAIGMQIGMNISNSLQGIKGEVDPAIVLRAITTTLNGGKPQLAVADAKTTLEAFTKRMQEKQMAQQKADQAKAQAIGQKNQTEGPAFLAANAKKPGVKTTASGLEYQVVKEGTGAKPKATDTVKVNYTGTLLDGTVFDSSAKNGGPISFAVNQVIAGWTEGLQLMPVGSKFTFWIPSNLAYGEKGTPGGPIGPNAALKFDVELLSVSAK